MAEPTIEPFVPPSDCEACDQERGFSFDDVDDWEPIGSCDNCGANIYDESEVHDGLCDQCAWYVEQAHV